VRDNKWQQLAAGESSSRLLASCTEFADRAGGSGGAWYGISTVVRLDLGLPTQ